MVSYRLKRLAETIRVTALSRHHIFNGTTTGEWVCRPLRLTRSFVMHLRLLPARTCLKTGVQFSNSQIAGFGSCAHLPRRAIQILSLGCDREPVSDCYVILFQER
jgi:hypothetical protein